MKLRMTRRIVIATALIIAASAASWAFDYRPRRSTGRTDGDEAGGRIQQGLAISPVPLDMTGKTPALVGLGSYLINAVGGCNDCHTCPSYAKGVEHNPYFGGDGQINADAFLAGGVPFQLGPVLIHSRNLTPDATGRPAGLSFEEFIGAIRTGHDPDNPGQFLQVMPWPVFRNMEDTDLLAIYEYLSAIPPQATPPDGTCQNPGEGTLPAPPPPAP